MGVVRPRALSNPGRFTKSIALILKELRVDRKLTQAEVARRVKSHGVSISRSTLSRVETGQADIAVGEMWALSRVYGVHVGYLMLCAEVGHLLPEAVDG